MIKYKFGGLKMSKILISKVRMGLFLLAGILFYPSVSYAQSYIKINTNGRDVDTIITSDEGVYPIDIIFNALRKSSFDIYTLCKVYGGGTISDIIPYQNYLYTLTTQPWMDEEYSGYYITAQAKYSNDFLLNNRIYASFNWEFSLPSLMHFDVFDSATDRLLDRVMVYSGGPLYGLGLFEAFAGGHYQIAPGQSTIFDASDSFKFFFGSDLEYHWDIDGQGNWSGEKAQVDYSSIQALGLSAGYHTVNLTMIGQGWYEDYDRSWHQLTITDTATADIYIIPEPLSFLLLSFGLWSLRLSQRWKIRI